MILMWLSLHTHIDGINQQNPYNVLLSHYVSASWDFLNTLYWQDTLDIEVCTWWKDIRFISCTVQTISTHLYANVTYAPGKASKRRTNESFRSFSSRTLELVAIAFLWPLQKTTTWNQPIAITTGQIRKQTAAIQRVEMRLMRSETIFLNNWVMPYETHL